MHALVITLGIEIGRESEGIDFVNTQVLPGMKQVPGLVAGYWLASAAGEGVTLLVFENQQAAKSAAAGITNAPMADFATLKSVDVREIVAYI